MSHYHVKPYNYEGDGFKNVTIPTSKSYTNRALILAAIAKESITLHHISDSTDVKMMIKAFREIGLEVEELGSSVTIKNSFPECERGNDNNESVFISTGDGGTTNRFLLGLLSRGKKKYVLQATGHMLKRPMEGLTKSLQKLGALVERDESGVITIQGPVKETGNVEVDCSKTTQYLTALLLAFSDKEKVFIKEINLESSKTYVELTKTIIKSFNGTQKEFDCPVDSSSLSYPLALGAVRGKVCIENCFTLDPYQADSIMVEHLKAMGAKVEFTKNGLTCEKSDLSGIEIDGGFCPDIVPTLCFVAAYASGTTIIKNIEVLRYKECDRIDETISLLEKFSVDYQFSNNTLTIVGKPLRPMPIHNISSLEVPADHRMVMVGSLFLCVNNGGLISNHEHVAKSYPEFFNSLLS